MGAHSSLLRWFNEPWNAVPQVWIDTETTGPEPGQDRAVQIGIVRFDGGAETGLFQSNVNPGRPIPEAATKIHGLTDDMVAGAPTIEDVFRIPAVQQLVSGAQPGGYNGAFDRHFVVPFGDDWTWPWFDGLTLVRSVDRFARGKGRHKLGAACHRHGVPIGKMHDALDDARAAGLLFNRIMGDCKATLGRVLMRQAIAEAEERFRFNEWLARQPPLESETDRG